MHFPTSDCSLFDSISTAPGPVRASLGLQGGTCTRCHPRAPKHELLPAAFLQPQWGPSTAVTDPWFSASRTHSAEQPGTANKRGTMVPGEGDRGNTACRRSLSLHSSGNAHPVLQAGRCPQPSQGQALKDVV